MDTLPRLEQKLTEVTHISGLLDEGMTPEEILEYVLADFEPKILEKVSSLNLLNKDGLN